MQMMRLFSNLLKVIDMPIRYLVEMSYDYRRFFSGSWMGFRNIAFVLGFISYYLNDKDDSKFLLDHAEEFVVTYQVYDWSLNV